MPWTRFRWGTATIAAMTASLLVAYRARPPFYPAKYESCSRPGHKESFARILPHLNVDGALQETYSTTIPLRVLETSSSDEEILARFSRGFFSGPAFTIERWLLCGPRASFLSSAAIVDALKDSTKPATAGFRIGSTSWSQDLSRFSSASVPAAGSLFFGNFLVLDTNSPGLREQEVKHSGISGYSAPSHPFVEWVFRGDSVGVASSHRFEVTRRQDLSTSGKHEEVLEITFSHVSCSPRTGMPIMGGWITPFHVLYSKYLFSDGIRAVLEQ